MLGLPQLWEQPGLLASLINRNWSEARQGIQAKLDWGPCSGWGRENRQQVPGLGHSLRGCGLHPYRGEVRALSRVRLEAGLRRSARPLDGLECAWHVQYPAFASEMAVGGTILFFWEDGHFVSCGHNLPQLHMHAVIFSPFWFLRILLLGGGLCPDASTAAKVAGPSLSQLGRAGQARGPERKHLWWGNTFPALEQAESRS